MKFVFRNHRNKEIEIYEEDLISAIDRLVRVVKKPGQYQLDYFAAFQEKLEEVKKNAAEYSKTGESETLDEVYMNLGRLETIFNLYYNKQTNEH